MRRAIKFLSVLATVCAMVWAASPVWGACGFNIPILQGGLGGNPPGAILNAGATHVNGFFWEVGNGDPIDNQGADCFNAFCNYPAFTRPLNGDRWIKGAPAAPLVNYDWRAQGTDGCIAGGAINTLSTAFAHYIIDSNDDYAIAVLSATDLATDTVDLDNLSTGEGANGNDIPMVALNGNAPQLENVTALSDTCAEGTVLPAACGVNAFSDLTGCDPYSVIDVNLLTLLNDGTPETCDPNTGCHLNCIERDAFLCWQGDTLVIGSSTPGSPICVGGGFGGSPCTPGDAGDPCIALGGVCPDAPPIITAMGFTSTRLGGSGL